MKVILSCIAALLCMVMPFTGTSYGQSDEQPDAPDKIAIDSLTIEDAVRFVIKNNPELKAFEKEIDAGSARIKQEQLFPNPSVFMETEDGSFKSFGFGKTYKSSFGIEQTVPLGGKIGARTAVARKEKEIAILVYENKLRDSVAETKKVFTTILSAQQLVKIVSDNRDIAQKLFDVAKIRVEALAAPETELIKAEIELSGAQIKFNNAEFELIQAEQQLHNLMGNVDVKIKNYRGELRRALPELPAPGIEQMAIASYPELLHAQKTRELAQKRYNLAKADRYPDIDIGVSAGREHIERENNTAFQWSIALPLPLFNRNQGRIQETKAYVIKAEKEYESLLNTIRSKIRRTILLSENSAHQVRTYEEKVLPNAEKSLELMSEGYREGKFTYIELLDAQRTLTQTREDYTKLLENLNITAIEIERLTGKTIEQSGKEER